MIDPAADLHAAFVELAKLPQAKVYRSNNRWACIAGVSADSCSYEGYGRTPEEAIWNALKAHGIEPQQPRMDRAPNERD